MALDVRREDVLRGVLRAVVAAPLLAVLSSVLRDAGPALPTSSALYVGLLALPATLFEGVSCRSQPHPSRWTLAVLAWAGACSGVFFAHAQAVYAGGVVDTGTLTGGAAAVELEWARLQRYEPEIGIRYAVFEAGTLAGLAAALATMALVRPVMGTSATRLVAWAPVHLAGLLAGALTVTLLEPQLAGVLPVVAIYLAWASAPALLAFAVAWVVSEAVLSRRE